MRFALAAALMLIGASAQAGTIGSIGSPSTSFLQPDSMITWCVRGTSTNQCPNRNLGLNDNTADVVFFNVPNTASTVDVKINIVAALDSGQTPALRARLGEVGVGNGTFRNVDNVNGLVFAGITPGDYRLQISTQNNNQSQGAQYNVMVTPLPAAVLMFGAAIAGLGALRKSSRSLNLAPWS